MISEETYKIIFGRKDLTADHKDEIVLIKEGEKTLIENSSNLSVIIEEIKKIHTDYMEKLQESLKEEYGFVPVVKEFLGHVATRLSNNSSQHTQKNSPEREKILTYILKELIFNITLVATNPPSTTPLKHKCLSYMKILDSTLLCGVVTDDIIFTIKDTSDKNTYGEGIYKFIVGFDKDLNVNVLSKSSKLVFQSI